MVCIIVDAFQFLKKKGVPKTTIEYFCKFVKCSTSEDTCVVIPRNIQLEQDTGVSFREVCSKRGYRCHFVKYATSTIRVLLSFRAIARNLQRLLKIRFLVAKAPRNDKLGLFWAEMTRNGSFDQNDKLGLFWCEMTRNGRVGEICLHYLKMRGFKPESILKTRTTENE